MKHAFRSIFAAFAALAMGVANRSHSMLFGHMARSGMILFEGDPTVIEKALKEIKEQVQEVGTKALKEAEKAGTLSAETKATVDKLLTDQGALKTQLEALEKKALKDPGPGNVDPLEAALLKAAPELKEFMDLRPMGKHINIPVDRKALTNTGITGTALAYPGDRVLSAPLTPLLRKLTIRDLIAPGRTTSSTLYYVRESGFTNNAAPVSEGSLKPKSEITFEMITSPVRTIAHLMDISLQMLDDVAFIQSYVEGRMRYGLALIEEAQLLTGSGTGQNLNGIYTQATAYAAPSGATINGAPAGGVGEQDIDKLRLALLQVELANAFASGIVLHPTDWAGIELLKDSTGQYLFTNPQTTTEARMWGRPVVTTQALTQGRFLTGDFRAHAQIFDRQDANLAISFENKDNFERNMATLRVEERLALAVYRPEAFVKGTLESAS